MSESSADLLAKGNFERVIEYTPYIEEMMKTLLNEGHLQSVDDLAAVGFKAVLGRNVSGCLEAGEQVLQALEDFEEVAPVHNAAYAEGIRCFRQKLPQVKRVALFETAFHQWMDPAASTYAIPKSWRDLGIRRYGFHGASHKFIAERTAELLDREDVAKRVRNLYVNGPGEFNGKKFRLISCHLGGSSSIAGIENGISIGASMGFSPQSGLPQNNRVGDLDPMAATYASRMLNLSMEEVKHQLNKESGFLGLSGVSNDIRDVDKAVVAGNADAQLATSVFIDSIRHWAGAFFFKMGGAEIISFTAGIGENHPKIRSAVCCGLEELGVSIDEEANRNATGDTEKIISMSSSKIKVVVIPANEELVVAREVYRYIQSN